MSGMKLFLGRETILIRPLRLSRYDRFVRNRLIREVTLPWRNEPTVRYGALLCLGT